MHIHSRAVLARNLLGALGAILVVGGCASLPVSGPTGNGIKTSAKDAAKAMGIELVELSTIDQLPAATVAQPMNFSNPAQPLPTDLVGPGDVLEISIYEAGVALFGGSSAKTAASAGFDPAVQVERMPPMRVDDNGYIRLPYTGRLRVMGMTTTEVEAMIRRSLRGMSQNPQVLVAIREVVANSVIVGGEVGKPGRLPLITNRESLSDVIALAGGYRGDAKDMTVRVERAGQVFEARLSEVFSGPDWDIRIAPGDRVAIVKAPRTFSVMGAPGRVEHFTFGGPSVSLAEAVAMAGGANPNTGDAKAIFVFRFVPNTAGTETPMVYHVNMMSAGSIFVAQRFAVRDKDVVYIGNAASNQPTKAVQIIGQLFSPLVTAGTLGVTLSN